MAFVSSDPGGRRRIRFTAPDGRQKTVRLGKCDHRTANGVKRHVEALLTAQLYGQPVRRETEAWLRIIHPQLRDRLARAGLIEAPRPVLEGLEQQDIASDRNASHDPGIQPRLHQESNKTDNAPNCPPNAEACQDQHNSQSTCTSTITSDGITLKAFLANYISERSDLALATRAIMQRVACHLVAALGENTKLAQVTPADADRFKTWLVQRGYGKTTIAQWYSIARHWFAVAVQRQVITTNPFDYMKNAVVNDLAPRKFIPAEEVCRVLEVIPCPQFRALVVLARWGGLRIPSEALNLLWSDVNWEKGQFIVRSTKTADPGSGSIRMVPLFPEVRAVLEELRRAAPEGEDRILSILLTSRQNLLARLSRYCKQAGVAPWPKPFKSLRASRAIELVNMFPSHVCSAWLSDTGRIVDSSYRQVTEEHWRQATSKPSVLHKALLDGSATSDSKGQSIHSPLPVLTGWYYLQLSSMGITPLAQT